MPVGKERYFRMEQMGNSGKIMNKEIWSKKGGQEDNDIFPPPKRLFPLHLLFEWLDAHVISCKSSEPIYCLKSWRKRKMCVCALLSQWNLAGAVGSLQESLPLISGSGCGWGPHVISLPSDLSQPWSDSFTNVENRTNTNFSDGDWAFQRKFSSFKKALNFQDYGK